MQAYMTQPRKRLLTYLHSHADETLTAGQLAEELPEISVSAIYRNLSALERDGAVQKVVRSGSREVFYRYKEAEACRDHLHMSCKKCGKTFHMNEAETQALVEAVAKLDGFEIDRGDTVLYGVCEACSART